MTKNTKQLKAFVITGTTEEKGSKKRTLVARAIDKGQIWNNPSMFGFRKVFKVEG